MARQEETTTYYIVKNLGANFSPDWEPDDLLLVFLSDFILEEVVQFSHKMDQEAAVYKMECPTILCIYSRKGKTPEEVVNVVKDLESAGIYSYYHSGPADTIVKDLATFERDLYAPFKLDDKGFFVVAEEGDGINLTVRVVELT